jgi:hypothetical protein
MGMPVAIATVASRVRQFGGSAAVSQGVGLDPVDPIQWDEGLGSLGEGAEDGVMIERRGA